MSDFIQLGLADMMRGADFAARGSALPAPTTNDQGDTLEDFKPDLTVANLIAGGDEYSPEDIQKIRQRARAGDGRKRAALGDEIERFAVCVQIDKMRQQLQSCDTLWEPTPTAEDTLGKEIAEYAEEQWGPWMADLFGIWQRVQYHGWGSARIITEARAGGKSSRGVVRDRIVDLYEYPARRFRLDYGHPDYPRWLLTLDPRGNSTLYVDELVARGELLFFETDRERPLDQRGLLFKILIPWAIAQFVMRWYAKKVEIHAIPPLIGRAQGPKDKARMKAALKQARAGLSIVIEGEKGKSDVEALMQIPSGSRDVHQELLELCLRMIDQVFWGHDQASGTRVGTGSQKANEVALEGVRDKTNAWARDFQRPFREQGLRPQVRRNYGQIIAGDYTPKVSMRLGKRDDPLTLATVAKYAQQVGVGELIDGEDFVQRIGLKLHEGKGKTLAALAPPVSPVKAVADAAAGGDPALSAHFSAQILDGYERIAARYGVHGARALEPIFAMVHDASQQNMGAVRDTLQELTDALLSAQVASAIAGKQAA